MTLVSAYSPGRTVTSTGWQKSVPGASAVTVYSLGRSETRSEAWRAIHARFAALVAALGSTGSRAVLEAAAALCDRRARDELAADARAAELAATFAGSTQLAGTLATIDRCLVRRAASGDLAAALATAPGP